MISGRVVDNTAGLCTLLVILVSSCTQLAINSSQCRRLARLIREVYIGGAILREKELLFLSHVMFLLSMAHVMSVILFAHEGLQRMFQDLGP